MVAARFLFVIAFAVAAPIAAFAAPETTAVWSDGHTSAVSDQELTRYATVSPGAGYPEEAQKTNATGNGLYELRIDKGGKVTVVAIVKSSGNAVLDKAATATFRKWRFKPAVFRSVRIPVSWSVNKVRK